MAGNPDGVIVTWSGWQFPVVYVCMWVYTWCVLIGSTLVLCAVCCTVLTQCFLQSKLCKNKHEINGNFEVWGHTRWLKCCCLIMRTRVQIPQTHRNASGPPEIPTLESRDKGLSSRATWLCLQWLAISASSGFGWKTLSQWMRQKNDWRWFPTSTLGLHLHA